MQVQIPTDADGFISQECPACNGRFMIQPGAGSPEPISHCPLCGHQGRDCWWTPEQLDYLKGVATSQLIGPELAKLNRHAGGLFKINVSSIPAPSPPEEPEGDFMKVAFGCCGETIKCDPNRELLYCPICGQEKEFVMHEPMKVFLSHKGCDKPVVRRFNDVLEQMGFRPWLDEDALHAGVELERGILNGFKESCAAIFFITPDFKDEQFLATEVDYAIQQKREKGDRFAIVTLRLANKSGQRGDIPELLKRYVWKEPDTDTEALREILRALPVQLGTATWKGESPTESPRVPIKKRELSEEAKRLLLAAVEDEHGMILSTTTRSGFEIQTHGKGMVPSQDARTIATWRAALKELLSANAIEGRGAKGEVFEVTKHGHDVAEQIRTEGLDEIDKAIVGMSEEARGYFLTLSRPRNQQGVPIDFFSAFSSRESAKYPEMLDSFVTRRLMRVDGSGYVITAGGYRTADRMWRAIILKQLAAMQNSEYDYIETPALAEAVGLTDGPTEAAELERLLQELVNGSHIEPVPSDGGIAGARLTPAGRGFLRSYATLAMKPMD